MAAQPWSMARPFQVSDPGSPGRGTVQNCQRRAPRRDVVGRDEPAHALVTARDPRDDEVTDHQWRRRRAVVRAEVGHHDLPQHLSRRAMQRDQAGVVGDHEQAVAGQGHAAIDCGAGVADDPRRPRPAVVPERLPRSRIQGHDLVGGADVHHAVDHERRGAQGADARHGKGPRRLETGDVVGRDLPMGRVPVATGVAVVGGPVVDRGRRQPGARRQGRHLFPADHVERDDVPPREPRHPAIAREEVDIVGGLGQHQAVGRAPVSQRRPHAPPRRAPTPGLRQPPDVTRDGRGVAGRERHGGHSAAGHPLADDALDLWHLAPEGRPGRDDIGPALGAATIGAVAGCASFGEDLGAAGVGCLGGRGEARDSPTRRGRTPQRGGT